MQRNRMGTPLSQAEFDFSGEISLANNLNLSIPELLKFSTIEARELDMELKESMNLRLNVRRLVQDEHENMRT